MRPLSCEVPTLLLSSGCTVMMLVPVLGVGSQSYFLFWVEDHDASSCSGCAVVMQVPVLGAGSQSFFLFWVQDHNASHLGQ
jgi:hypothetical protein